MTPVAYVLFSCVSVNGAEARCSAVEPPNGGPPLFVYSTLEKCEADLQLRHLTFARVQNHRFYNGDGTWYVCRGKREGVWDEP